MAAHALLGASKAEQWINCPPSARAQESITDEQSPYAAEGHKAHELAEIALKKGIDAQDVAGDYPKDMREFVQVYVDYVRSQVKC